MPTSLLAIATKALEDYFFQVPDTEASTFEEPGARKRHAGICAGAVRATGRPTAMPDTPMKHEEHRTPDGALTLVVSHEDDDITIGFDGFQWHTHGDVLAAT